MTSSLLFQLGQVLVQSLWQGAILGAVLMVLLVFVKQPRVRYALSCLTLLAMLAWFVMSWVQVSSPSVTSYTLETNYAVPERPTSSMPTEPVTSTPTFTANQPLQPIAREADQQLVNSSEQPEARAIIPKLRLQDFLPYISIVWMFGVALLSIRLLISFYLLRRYRKGSFELTEPWLLERMQVLAGRLNLRQRITLLQTNALAMPAVMGVLKPLVLLPPSLVSGLSVGQLELILAHELAHIKRRDYLVNILQTLAETLLFYHLVVWWVSKTIRQEREHCCDDLALQVTGQSAVEYADVLLRLEKSRQTMALAASGGSLLRRVERLLSPARTSADLRSGIVAFALVLALSLTLVVNAVNAQPIQVSKVPYVFNAGIAVDPTNPERIAVSVNQKGIEECQYNCKVTSLLYTSTDAGKNWQEQSPYGEQSVINVLQTLFYKNGELIVTTDLVDPKVSTFIARASNSLQIEETSISPVMGYMQGSRVTVNPDTGMFYLSFVDLAPTDTGWVGKPKLRMSQDGKIWSRPLVDILSESILKEGGRYVKDVRVLLGEGQNLAVVWTQFDYLPLQELTDGNVVPLTDTLPYTIWFATSSDGGQTFSAPKRRGESWGDINTAYSKGVYYILSKQISTIDGSLRLVLYFSSDNGLTWRNAEVNRNTEIFSNFPNEIIPGLSASPDGTVDVVFYAQIDGENCVSVAAPFSRQWTDRCSYNVYHTSSKDKGNNFRGFSTPKQLNEEPIVGSQFVRLYGSTTPGQFISIASTNEAAYPVWIGNREGVEGTQAYMMKIER